MTTDIRRRIFVVALVMLVMIAARAPRAFAQPVYMAFAQSGGFHPNGVWGRASNADRAVAIGDALRNCQVNSLTCDSELDCLLRPGTFAAFASDGKTAGNRGISCGKPTAALAAAEAMAWCGAGCQPIWSGSADGSSDMTIEDAKAWVRTTFRAVVGRTPGEAAVKEYAEQLEAHHGSQEMKDFLIKVVFSSLH